ncbi:MAG: shikimate dehydrogenase [bacterium]|nr:shikimate dehydrogenase [bacterium]
MTNRNSLLFPAIDGTTTLYGIIGNPVAHSFSPLMHSQAFWQVGHKALYLPFPVEPEDLPQLLEAFRIASVQGFNVTVPYKEAIVPFLDDLTEEAQLLGSVNTVWREAGRWKGHSTDGPGFVRGLKERGWQVEGRSATLLGAGGSAKAVAFSLLKAGLAQLHIKNRTRAKAEELASKLAEIFGADRLSVGLPEGGADLLVNCTSVGLKADLSPLPKGQLEAYRQVVDIIYNPAQTRLLKDAQDLGLEWDNGLAMLLYQGVESFEIWTGRPAPVALMKETLAAQLQGK